MKALIFIGITSCILVACSTAPEESGISIQLQYRIRSIYTANSSTPVQTALARANIYTRTKYRPKVAPIVSFALNGQMLTEAGEGTHILNDIPVVGDPYILKWLVAGYSDSTINIIDTITAPMTVISHNTGDSVSKTKGTSISYSNSNKPDGMYNNRIYCLIMKDNFGGERDFSADTRTMFDQNDNGSIDISPEILSTLRPNVRYILIIERGNAHNYPRNGISIVSNTFSELTVGFYLTE